MLVNSEEPTPILDLISVTAASKIAEEAFKSRAYYLKRIQGLEKNLYNLRKDARRKQKAFWRKKQIISAQDSKIDSLNKLVSLRDRTIEDLKKNIVCLTRYDKALLSTGLVLMVVTWGFILFANILK